MEVPNRAHKKRVNPNTFTGLVLLVVGGILLLRQSGYPLPNWLFSWEMIVITIGIMIGIRNRFQDFAWLVMVIVGLVFLSDDIYPDTRLRQFAVPIIIISVGLLFIFAPKKMCKGRHRRRFGEGDMGPNSSSGDLVTDEAIARDTTTSPVLPVTTTAGEAYSDTVLDIVSIFAGVKKNVLSKQFRGGEVVCVFGGAEVNLTNADFISPIEIDVVNVFGGTKLIIPSNWEVRSEATAIFGGIDDKRVQGTGIIPEKIIVLKGTIMFGGIEVNSF
jgi:predicted membrane protein